MYREFNQTAKERGFRGWRLEELDGHTYISKFDDHFNDDELRFFIDFNEEGQAYISHMNRLKTSTDRIVKIHSTNEYIKRAEELCTWIQK